MTIAIAK